MIVQAWIHHYRETGPSTCLHGQVIKQHKTRKHLVVFCIVLFYVSVMSDVSVINHLQSIIKCDLPYALVTSHVGVSHLDVHWIDQSTKRTVAKFAHLAIIHPGGQHMGRADFITIYNG